MSWVRIDNINELKIGDYIRAQTGTWSQKYMRRFGYNDCNTTYEGEIVQLGENTVDILIKLKDGTVRNAVKYVGTSGWHDFERFECSEH